MTLFVCFGDLLIRFLYDPRYWQAAWMLPLLALGLWPRLLCNTIEPALFAIAKPQYTTVAQVARVAWTVIGVLVGILRLSRNWLVARIMTGYVETFRNVPLLLQLFVWYFAVLRTLPHPRASWGLADAVFLNNRGLYLPGPHPENGFWLVLLALAAGVIGAVWVSVHAKRVREATGAITPVFPLVLALIVVPPDGQLPP